MFHVEHYLWAIAIDGKKLSGMGLSESGTAPASAEGRATRHGVWPFFS